MPINPSWLLWGRNQDVVDRVRAQKSAQNDLSANTFRFAQKKGPFRILSPNHAFGSQHKQPIAKIENGLEGVLEVLSRENLILIRVRISLETVLVTVITNNLVTVLSRLYRRLTSPFEHS